MKKFLFGLGTGLVVGYVLEGVGIVKLVIDDGVDVTQMVKEIYAKTWFALDHGINSWGRRYSTPKKRH